jgi:hypothetical protein
VPPAPRCDLSHPDLAPNLWVNAGEVPGNGKDDDGNGAAALAALAAWQGCAACSR